MRIIFLSRYQGKVERGVENYVTELASRLKKLGNKVEVLTSFWQLPRFDLPRSDLTIIYPLNGYWQTLGCRLYAWMIGAKLVVGGHAGIGRDDRWNLYMLPDLFIAFSQKGYEWAKKNNLMIRIIRLPHGVNLDKFNLTVRPAKLGLEKPVFVTAAHLEPYKRIDLTVKAVAELKKGSLLVLGEGPLQKEIDELGKRLLGDKGEKGEKREKRYLRLVLRHDQVAAYLRSGDVFTLVSGESEAFGLVYLEAMACGLPIVASDDSLRRELIGDSGVFVKNPEDSGEYARCLEGAIGEDWGDRPVKQAKRFDWEKIANRYLEEFTGL